MAANLTMTIVAAICLAAIGIWAAVTDRPGDLYSGWEGAVGVAAFTVFFTMVAALVCIPRVRVLAWIFASFSLLFSFATLIAVSVGLGTGLVPAETAQDYRPSLVLRYNYGDTF
jgi:hypothetical protein